MRLVRVSGGAISRLTNVVFTLRTYEATQYALDKVHTDTRTGNLHFCATTASQPTPSSFPLLSLSPIIPRQRHLGVPI